MKHLKHALPVYLVLAVGAALLTTAACAKKSSSDGETAAPAPAATQNATSVQKCGVGINFDPVTNQCLPLAMEAFSQTTFVAQYQKDNPNVVGEMDVGNGSFHSKFGIEVLKICNQDKWDNTGLNCGVVFKNSTFEIRVTLNGSGQQNALVEFFINPAKNPLEQGSNINGINPIFYTNMQMMQNQMWNSNQNTMSRPTPFSFDGIVTKYTGEARIPGTGGVVIENRPDSDGFLVVPNKMGKVQKNMEDMVLLVKKGSPRDPKVEFMFVHPDNYNHNWISGKLQNCNTARCN